MTYPRLELESIEDPDGEFITLAVRMKLDLAGCRISLQDWKMLSDETQRSLHDFVTETSQEIQEFKTRITNALKLQSRCVPEDLSSSAIASVSKWKDPGQMPAEVSTALLRNGLDVVNWEQVNRFTRYVLWSFATKKGGQNFTQAYADLVSCKLLPE